jgi:hypothetical protein
VRCVRHVLGLTTELPSRAGSSPAGVRNSWVVRVQVRDRATLYLAQLNGLVGGPEAVEVHMDANLVALERCLKEYITGPTDRAFDLVRAAAHPWVLAAWCRRGTALHSTGCGLCTAGSMHLASRRQPPRLPCMYVMTNIWPLYTRVGRPVGCHTRSHEFGNAAHWIGHLNLRL